MRALAIACLCLGAHASAQNAPVFHSETPLVQINVIVRDKNGPVANLTKGDFKLTDRGKLQNISVFSVTSAAHAEADPALPENTFSNRAHAPASVTVVLLDRLNTLTGAGAEGYESSPVWLEDHALAFAKQKLVEFVKDLDPKDRVAIYSLGQSLAVLSDFTNDRDQLAAILAKYRATSITSREKVEPESIHTPVPGEFNANVDADRSKLAGMANAQRVQITMAALRAISAHLASIPGRKNLVWMTADLPFSGVMVARAMARADIAIYPVDARGLLPRSTGLGGDDDIGFMPGPMGSGKRNPVAPPGISTMNELASETGGRAFINTNDLAGAIRKAVDDGAVTYTLGFYPESSALDGKFHDIRVHVRHPGSEVRAPTGYFASRDSDPLPNPSRAAIDNPLESSEIHILARMEHAAPDALSISASIDLHDLALALVDGLRQGLANVDVFQQDPGGQPLDRRHSRLKIALTSAEYDAYLKTGLSFRQIVPLKSGAATVRFVVEDAGNHATGTLIVPLSSVK